MKSFLFVLLQYILPHHLLSRIVGWFASTEITWIKNLFIQRFAANFDVNMAEAAQESLLEYKSFNAFFCRALKPEARPLEEEENALLCPADGAISQAGTINGNTIFQAKGKSFSTTALLGGDETLAKKFENGQYCTVYLSPKDYHRVHMPISGTLTDMIHVPGALFSVNPTTVNNVDNLFARNERVVSIFETDVGPVAVVLVGAMIVASIETVWAGEIAPRGNKVTRQQYGEHPPISLTRGSEMGRFKLGSTAVLLMPENSTNWLERMTPGRTVKMGEPLATIKKRH
ncbi:archaetidylserine decarboxylase [Teredinibacter purpureus]|uniref:archaetidylserine decarboxylase n=1 Tax=Teredinibacter purpureus TaxID=2731756 RepID=UPI0005F80B5D|nr:archaetidylserine decarboxylase [Teredinibacter purpureus]